MQWVKASERLPIIINSYCCKVHGGYTTLWLRQKRDGVYVFADARGYAIRRNIIEWLDESENAVYAIEVPQNKLYQLYTKEQIINAHMAGQRNAGVDPSYSAALAYYEQSKKEV